jgi:hypothetical protein
MATAVGAAMLLAPVGAMLTFLCLEFGLALPILILAYVPASRPFYFFVAPKTLPEVMPQLLTSKMLVERAAAIRH